MNNIACLKLRHTDSLTYQPIVSLVIVLGYMHIPIFEILKLKY